MDKNPDQVLQSNFTKNFRKLSENSLNVVQFSDPLVKLKFLNNLINSSSQPVVFLDCDLLYSGYAFEMTGKNKVKAFQPSRENFKETLSSVVREISHGKCLIILDSLNGLYNIFDQQETGVFTNRVIMFLAFAAKQHNSRVIVSAMARKKDDNEWILSPKTRQIIEFKNLETFHVQNNGNMINARNLKDDK